MRRKIQLKTMTKRFSLVCIILCFIFALSACEKENITVDEIKKELPKLIEDSTVLNEIYFGIGFKPDGKYSDVRASGGYFYCLTEKTGFNSILEIKEATEKVFSPEYSAGIYEYAFVGLSTESVVVAPRFMEGEYGLMQSVDADIRYLPERVYKYDTLEIVEEGSDRVKVSVMTTVSGKEEKVELSVVRTGQKGAYSYRLDSPTY